MAEKPSSLPKWATNENYAGGPDIGTPTKVVPPAGRLSDGWRSTDRAPAQHWNWLANLQNLWIEWLDSVSDIALAAREVQWVGLEPELIGFGSVTTDPARHTPVISMGYRPATDASSPQWLCAPHSPGTGTTAKPLWSASHPNRWTVENAATPVVGKSALGKHAKSLMWSKVANMWIYVTSALASGSSTSRLFTSADGKTWVERATVTEPRQGHFSIAESSNIIVVTSDAGASPTIVAAHFFTSTDGVTWTSRTNPTGSQMRGIAWSPKLGRFTAVGANDILTSTNGTSWSALTVPVAQVWNDVIWDAHSERFIAVSHEGFVLTSSDGISWTNRGRILLGVDGKPINPNSLDTDNKGSVVVAGHAPELATTGVSVSRDGGESFRALNVVCNNGLDIRTPGPPFRGGVRYLYDRFWLFGQAQKGLITDNSMTPAIAYSIL